MKRLYYRMMSRFTSDVAWFLFVIEPNNGWSGGWHEAHLHYERQISKLDHPSRGR